jgi:hypothetical protein
VENIVQQGYNAEFYNLASATNIRATKLTGHATRTGKMRNASRILICEKTAGETYIYVARQYQRGYVGVGWDQLT